MKDEVRTLLFDVLSAARAVKTFVAGRSLEDYRTDDLLRSAVERKFQIMGEALRRIGREDPTALEQIRDYRDIISFRNILVHGYDAIDDRIVWGVIEEDLDNLIEDGNALLR